MSLGCVRRNKAEPDTMASTQARTRDFCEGAGRGKGTGMVSARARRRTNGQHYQGLPVRSDHTSLFTGTKPLQQNYCTILYFFCGASTHGRSNICSTRATLPTPIPKPKPISMRVSSTCVCVYCRCFGSAGGTVYCTVPAWRAWRPRCASTPTP